MPPGPDRAATRPNPWLRGNYRFVATLTTGRRWWSVTLNDRRDGTAENRTVTLKSDNSGDGSMSLRLQLVKFSQQLAAVPSSLVTRFDLEDVALEFVHADPERVLRA